MSNKIDASKWYWHAFHRRGWFSHRHRCAALKHIPMPASGDEQAWLESRVVQARVCLSPDYLVAALQVVESHLDLIAKADHADVKWWEEHAPTGCVSPLGTFAAADAFMELRDDYAVRGFYHGVTVPFLFATLREAVCLFMSFAFLWLLPFAYPVRCLMAGAPVDFFLLFALSGVSGIAAHFAEQEYRRQL